MNKYNEFPWAAPYVGPATRLTADQARLAFGEYHYDAQAIYVSCGDGYVRRVVLEDEARANTMTFVFTGGMCANGHLAPRKLRVNSTPECMACRRQAKRRARKKARFTNSEFAVTRDRRNPAPPTTF